MGGQGATNWVSRRGLGRQRHVHESEPLTRVSIHSRHPGKMSLWVYMNYSILFNDFQQVWGGIVCGNTSHGICYMTNIWRLFCEVPSVVIENYLEHLGVIFEHMTAVYIQLPWFVLNWRWSNLGTKAQITVIGIHSYHRRYERDFRR